MLADFQICISVPLMLQIHRYISKEAKIFFRAVELCFFHLFMLLYILSGQISTLFITIPELRTDKNICIIGRLYLSSYAHQEQQSTQNKK